MGSIRDLKKIELPLLKDVGMSLPTFANVS